MGRNDGRDRVHGRIARALRRFPDLDLGGLNTTGLEMREAAFARALDQAIIRRWLTLETVVSSQVDRPWARLDDEVAAALLIGSAQLLLLDQVPPHAAINETVTRVRERTHSGAAGLVNAVLRKIARLQVGELPASDPAAGDFHARRDLIPLADGRAIVLGKEIFAEDPVIRLVQQTSHGEDLVVHWISAHGLAKTRTLCHHDLLLPPVLLTAEDPSSIADGPVEPHDRSGFHVWKGKPGELGAFMQANPGARVQDPASAEPVAATAGIEAGLIVDYCAGRGTKTRQLAEMHPGARIIASDIDARRAEDLARAFEGHPGVDVVQHGDFREAIGRTDLLVLDVPCTNTGVLPRRPEAKYRFGPRSLDSLARLQRKIFREAEPLLAPEGMILFSTCSLEPLENRRQVEQAARRFGMRIRSQAQRFPEGLPGDPPNRIHDGSFFAILERDPGARKRDRSSP
ncbi:MAG: hypothetical protein MK085_01065 [Phycisphaerales bacterium]|nr:hypothetical protein [Phycisphaerales bacterium]